MPLLRIPPFPGSTSLQLARPSRATATVSDAVLREAIRSIRRCRAAGTYWGGQVDLPDHPFRLIRTRNLATGARIAQSNGLPIVLWTNSGNPSRNSDHRFQVISGSLDPWHLLTRAAEVIVDADDELATIAAIADVPMRCMGEGPFQAVAQGESALLQALHGPILAGSNYCCPFTGRPISLLEAVDLCAFWRRMIDSNRTFKAAIGFAKWKRPTVAPLIWAGSGAVPFTSKANNLSEGDEVAIWKSRVAAHRLAELDQAGANLVEVEDGFIRSVGLGADCIPPLSIIVDRIGVYFDPQRPSELEALLQEGRFSAELLERAAKLRQLIVESGISKYDVGGQRRQSPSDGRHRLLVIGQVEDDRSVRCGGGSVQTNLELLRRARQIEPNAFISYRPHPDVSAGHRVGQIPQQQLADLADEEIASGSIAHWLDRVDEVHVNTSLAGFEALLRGKPVTTHGVPFYAGWGLTRDLGDVPQRRTSRRSLDELVAAVLLMYPRYLDPETGIPCPAEILALRLAQVSGTQSRDLLVRLRRLQGQLKRRAKALRLWMLQ